MIRMRDWLWASVLMVSVALQVAAQQPAASAGSAIVPPVVKFSGVLKDANGKAVSGVAGVIFLLYLDEQGGAPLWMETQNVRPDKSGHYSVVLGSTTSHGLPADLFVSGEARWLGVQLQGQPEQPRVLLVSVPYALKAGDAETVGGLPPSAFVLATPVNSGSSSSSSSASNTGASPSTLGGSGKTNYLPIWTNPTTLGSSVLFQSGTGAKAKLGIGTAMPTATLDVNGGGTIRGLFSLPATGTATATTGFSSQPSDFVASVFNSGTSTAVPQIFQWQAEPVGNNTTNATGSLNLLFAQGTGKPKETGLNVASSGQITFASGQSFPGTGTITGVTAGSGLTGGGTSGKVSLSVPSSGITNTMLQNSLVTVNAGTALTGGGPVALGGSTTLSVDTTKVVTGVIAGTGLTGGGAGGVQTLNLDTNKVPQLSANNRFTGNQAVNGALAVSGGANYQPFFVQSSNSFGTWLQLSNTSSGGHTWNLISAGATNSEGAGDLGITDLTGTSTIWLEGNVQTSNMTANAGTDFSAGRFVGWTAPPGSGTDGGWGVEAFAGNGDTTAGSVAVGGRGVYAAGGQGTLAVTEWLA
jgi:hypothetical protein